MSEKPISPLRRRMIEDMSVRNFVEKTRNDYIRQVRTFTAFLGRSPDTATAEDLRRFQLHQTQTGVRPPSINGSVAALRFFFTVTLDRPELARHLTFVREPRKIPVVLSPEEVARLLEAAPGPKYTAALSAAYAAGLRVSEVVALKVSDIDPERLLLRNRRHQDRYVMTATTGLRPRRLDLASCWSSTGCHHARPTAPCGHQRKPATANPSCCCLPVALLLAPRRIALFRAHLRRQPNPHSQGRGASAHHRPRVRSLAAFGRRPTCTWLRRSSPASETLHISGHRLFRVHQRYRRLRAVTRPPARHNEFVGGAAVKRLRDRLLHLSRIALAIGCAVASTGAVQAAEIKLMSSGGMRVALIALAPAFERVTKHKIAATYGAPGTIRDRVLAGEPMDVLVFPDAGLDALAKQGKIVSGSKVILARSGMGVAVRAGAPKPDISTPDAFKRALLAAKSIVYTNPALGSPSGVHFAKVLERLGIAEEMEAKSRLHDGTSFNAELVARGEIELAIQQISEIVPVKGVELAGPLPGDLQLTTVFAIGIGAAAEEQVAAHEFIKFLTSPAAAAVIRATGMEPLGS